MTGDVPAVLYREQSLSIQVPCPGEQAFEPWVAGAHRELGEHPTRRGVDRNRRVGLFVRVDPHYDHLWSPFLDAHTGW